MDLGRGCDTDEIRFPLQVYKRVEKQVLPTMQKKLAVTAAKGWLSERFGCKLPCLGMFGVCLNYRWENGDEYVVDLEQQQPDGHCQDSGLSWKTSV